MIEEHINIRILNSKGEEIPKESLSMGEKQLYATALLKALVDESGIKFPVFIDSPLQKFDKYHSKNIIKEFYPAISEQVVLFPLLEKELSEFFNLNSFFLFRSTSVPSLLSTTNNATSSSSSTHCTYASFRLCGLSVAVLSNSTRPLRDASMSSSI